MIYDHPCFLLNKGIALAKIEQAQSWKRKVVGRRTVEGFNLATEEGEGWAREKTRPTYCLLPCHGWSFRLHRRNYVLGIREGRRERRHTWRFCLSEVRESMKGHLRLRLRSKGSPLLREVVISSCLLGERKLPDHLFQPDSERSLSNEH